MVRDRGLGRLRDAKGATDASKESSSQGDSDQFEGGAEGGEAPPDQPSDGEGSAGPPSDEAASSAETADTTEPMASRRSAEETQEDEGEAAIVQELSSEDEATFQLAAEDVPGATATLPGEKEPEGFDEQVLISGIGSVSGPGSDIGQVPIDPTTQAPDITTGLSGEGRDASVQDILSGDLGLADPASVFADPIDPTKYIPGTDEYDAGGEDGGEGGSAAGAGAGASNAGGSGVEVDVGPIEFVPDDSGGVDFDVGPVELVEEDSGNLEFDVGPIEFVEEEKQPGGEGSDTDSGGDGEDGGTQDGEEEQGGSQDSDEEEEESDGDADTDSGEEMEEGDGDVDPGGADAGGAGDEEDEETYTTGEEAGGYVPKDPLGIFGLVDPTGTPIEKFAAPKDPVDPGSDPGTEKPDGFVPKLLDPGATDPVQGGDETEGASGGLTIAAPPVNTGDPNDPFGGSSAPIVSPTTGDTDPEHHSLAEFGSGAGGSDLAAPSSAASAQVQAGEEAPDALSGGEPAEIEATEEPVQIAEAPLEESPSAALAPTLDEPAAPGGPGAPGEAGEEPGDPGGG